MKILQVVEATSGGVGAHVINLSRGLAANGHDVVIAYAKPRMDKMFADGLEELAGMGVKSVVVDMPAGISKQDWVAVKQLKRVLKEYGPFDVLHAQSSKAGGALRLANGPRGLPLVYTPHLLRTASPGLSKPMRVVFGGLERYLAKRTDKLIMVSEFEKEHAISEGIPAGKIEQFPNGIPPLKFRPRAEVRAEFGLGEDDIVIGFVGRFSPQKFPELMIEAFQKAHRSGVKMLMVGAGELLEGCKSQAEAAGLASDIFFVGEKRSFDYMKGFDILALSSRSESMPTVVIEGMQCGLPIVSTDVGNARELLLDGEVGTVVAPGDSGALAVALGALIENAELRAKYAEKALVRAQDFTVERMVANVERVYRNVIRE